MKTKLLHERFRQLLVALLLALPLALSAQSIHHGDVNGDTEVNIMDVDAVINVILSGHNSTTADVNRDGEVNILDVDNIISIILYGDEDDELHEICEKVVEIDDEIIDYYEQCESIDELMTHKDEIEAMDGVEYVFSNDNTTMYVVIKDFGTISYSYYPVLIESNTQDLQIFTHEVGSILANVDVTHDHVINKQDAKALVVYQQARDESRRGDKSLIEGLNDDFNLVGIESRFVTSLDIEFFRTGLFLCDYLFLSTHGGYEFDEEKYKKDNTYRGIHWLLTTEELPTNKKEREDLISILRKEYSEEDLSFGTVTETRNGERVSVEYFKVSDHFIESSNNSFDHPGKAIVFNTACHSLQGPGIRENKEDTVNYNFGRVFARRGAGAYFGYDQSNSHGRYAGLRLFYNLLSGMSLKSAYDNLQFELFHDHEFSKETNSWYWADLFPYYSNESLKNICITKPDIDYEDASNDNEIKISLHAINDCGSYIFNFWFETDENGAPVQKRSYDIDNLSEYLKYGFELSESEQFTDAISIGDKRIGDEGCNLTSNYNLDYKETLTYSPSDPNSKIKPGTTYWARAYVYDGQGYNYSEPISFTTKGGITVPTTEVEFGNVSVGSNPTQMLEIQNSSAIPQTVTVKVTSPFSIAYNQSSTSSLTLQVPGNSCSSVTLMFVATHEGDFQGTATVTSSAIDGGSISVPVHAHVVADDPGDTEVIPVGNTGVTITMVPVEGGTFTMGATPEQGSDYESNEIPTHQVTVSSFSIAQTEVTQALWVAVMGTNPSEFQGNLNRPVENVSWNDCKTFINKLNEMTGKNFRLPTEAEWEFAARVCNKKVGNVFKYAGSNNVDEVAWYWYSIPSQAAGTPGYGTQPVATKKANELGLYDMSGNVYEWIQDRYGSYDADAQTNPTGPSYGSYRVVRGGTWGTYANFCRVSNRNSFSPSTKSSVLGLRLAL